MSSSGDEMDRSLGEHFGRSAEQMTKLRARGVAAAKRMLAYIDASPTPYHAVDNAARQLREDGFERLDERQAWTLTPGDRRFVIRHDGTLIAFAVGTRSPAEAGFRIIGAHTDSPNLRLKPRGSRSSHGYRQLGVEIYGGVLLSTWLDRDLSIAGHVCVRNSDGGLEDRLIDLRRPIGRVPALAIHLNRKVNSDGLVLNKQTQMVPLVGMGERPLALEPLLAAELGVKAEAVMAAELCCYDTQKGAIGGVDDELVLSARIDNLASCHAAIEAICGAADDRGPTAVIALYDHEECGSRSASGAASGVLRDVLERVALAYPEGQVQALSRAMAGSLLVSADAAHAIHPSYPDKHDGEHAPLLGRGLVIKTNANQSYATSASSAAELTELCRECGFEPQQFVSRGDVPCGSTIGPITAAELGVRTVDVGIPMLSMHSCREVAGSLDVHLAVQIFARLFR